jgi:oligopeptide/dipeptide ABC transporter ATP-binding protein
MLIASVPRLDKKWEEVEVKLKAKHSKLPTGCVYYERCLFADKDKDCAKRPPLIEAESGHFVACSHYMEVNKGV